MGKRSIHVVPHKRGWAVKREGSSRAVRVTRTKQEALDIGRKLAKKSKVELVIHNEEGRIIDKDSYGHDPYPPKDKKH